MTTKMTSLGEGIEDLKTKNNDQTKKLKDVEALIQDLTVSEKRLKKQKLSFKMVRQSLTINCTNWRQRLKIWKLNFKLETLKQTHVLMTLMSN